MKTILLLVTCLFFGMIVAPVFAASDDRGVRPNANIFRGAAAEAEIEKAKKYEDDKKRSSAKKGEETGLGKIGGIGEIPPQKSAIPLADTDTIGSIGGIGKIGQESAP